MCVNMCNKSQSWCSTSRNVHVKVPFFLLSYKVLYVIQCIYCSLQSFSTVNMLLSTFRRFTGLLKSIDLHYFTGEVLMGAERWVVKCITMLGATMKEILIQLQGFPITINKMKNWIFIHLLKLNHIFKYTCTNTILFNKKIPMKNFNSD